jgi:hypothetical protein
MHLLFLILAASVPPPVPVAPAPPVHGLTCTGPGGEVRQFTLDVTGKRWKESGKKWARMAAVNADAITLVRERSRLSDFNREEVLDRTTLTLSSRFRSGLIDDVRTYRCDLSAAAIEPRL